MIGFSDNRLGLVPGSARQDLSAHRRDRLPSGNLLKFKLGGMSKVPPFRVAGDPNRLAFTLNYPPFVAVSVGDKYLLTFDATRVNEDLGLYLSRRLRCDCCLSVATEPGAPRRAATVTWSLSTSVRSSSCSSRISSQAMGTSKVFNEYLQDVSAFYTASTGQRACCGDVQVKIVHRTGVELEVHLEVNLDRKPVIGHSSTASGMMPPRPWLVRQSDGYLYCMSCSTDADAAACA